VKKYFKHKKEDVFIEIKPDTISIIRNKTIKKTDGSIEKTILLKEINNYPSWMEEEYMHSNNYEPSHKLFFDNKKSLIIN